MVAHGLFHILHGEFARGLDVEGEGVVDLAVDVGEVLVHGRVVLAEEGPHAGIAGPQGAEVGGIIGLGKAEILVQPVEIAHLAGKRNDIGRIEAVLLVFQRELVNAGIVGVTGNAVVGDTHGYPHGTPAPRALADEVHDPGLVGVGNGEGLATAAIAIFLDQAGHHLDGLAGGLGPFESQLHERTVVDDAGGIDQLGTSAPGRLDDGELVLVHVAQHGISVIHLFDFAQRFVGIPLDNLTHGTLGPVGGRRRGQRPIEGVGVGRIGYQHTPVGRSLLTGYQTRTGPSLRPSGHGQKR